MIKVLKEIDRFYYLLGIVLAIISVIVIVMLRTIFASFEKASRVDEETFDSSVPRIDRIQLEDLHNKLYDSAPPQLDL